MAERRPLVLVGGRVKMLPAGDTAPLDTLPAAAVVAVVHGATASAARPAATVVHWSGSVSPSNASIGDLWRNTATDNIWEKTGTGWRDISLPAAGGTGEVLASDGMKWLATSLAPVALSNNYADLDNLPTLLGDAPSDGNTYGRKNGAWVGIAPAAQSSVIPVVTGEVAAGQPVFVIGPNGSLIYGAV